MGSKYFASHQISVYSSRFRKNDLVISLLLTQEAAILEGTNLANAFTGSAAFNFGFKNKIKFNPET
jgi:hypothetical protein